MVHRLPIINYDHLPHSQVAPYQEGTMSDHIGWVLTHPDLEDQVCRQTAHINHFQVFSETYRNCATLGMFITKLQEHCTQAAAPAVEKERITKVAHEAHLVCVTAAQQDIHEAIDQAASDPMDTDPLDYTATRVSLEDLASMEDKWNQFIYDQAAVAQGQPLDSPLVQSENLAGDPSIAKEATTMIDPFADPSLVILSQVFVISKEESEQQHIALYVNDTLARRDNVPATPDYLALTQSMNSTPFDRDEVLRWFHEVYMGDWQYTDDHRITNFRDHTDRFFKDLDDMNGQDDLGGGEGANVTILGLVV
ncbi:hypothetical protein V8D89_008639 [Ganoderma adspersum]